MILLRHIGLVSSASVLVVLSSACSAGDSPGPSDEEAPDGPKEMEMGGAGGESTAPEEDPPQEPDEPTPSEELECPELTVGFATGVVEHSFGEGQDFGQDAFPEQILGGPRGGGMSQGSLHVTSLGDGGYVVLKFEPRVIVDGPGADFIVFENPFYAGGDPTAPVAELGRIAVSNDGEKWHEFPCDPGSSPPYPGCSGWTPVVANVEKEDSVSAFVPEEAGGEAYDLADVGLDEARFVRVSDIAGDDLVYDLDAVAVVNGRCEPE